MRAAGGCGSRGESKAAAREVKGCLLACAAPLVPPSHLQQVLQHCLLRDRLQKKGRHVGTSHISKSGSSGRQVARKPGSWAANAKAILTQPTATRSKQLRIQNTSNGNLQGPAPGRPDAPARSSARSPPWRCPPCCWWGARPAPRTAWCTSAASGPARKTMGVGEVSKRGKPGAQGVQGQTRVLKCSGQAQVRCAWGSSGHGARQFGV